MGPTSPVAPPTSAGRRRGSWFPEPSTHSEEVTPIGYVTGAVLGSGVLGFLAGLFSFKVKTQWCRDCGEQLRCVACHERERAVATDRNRPMRTVANTH
jgi:hypothetical protein